MSERSFVALWPDAAARREIDARFRELIPRAWRRPDASELHVTLFFLGAIESDVAQALDRELAGVAARHAPLVLALHGPGAFPSRGRERVLWLGIQERGAARIAALQRDVERACVASGFAADERPWSPHLTLARAPRERGPDARVADAFFAQDFEISWQPAELTRVVSHTANAPGERYAVAARFPLGGAGR